MAIATVLTVDDSPIARRLFKTALKTRDFNFLEAGSGREGLKVADENTVNLFLVDYNMPEMDGLEFVRQIRGTEKYRETPIFMITTETMEDIKQEGKRLGVSSWIIKPIKPEQLLFAVDKILGLKD